jgi:Zn-dependent peptidase ImmA (M78 family)
MSSSLRHGFKAEAERLASSMRQQLRLSARDRLEGLVLAGHLGVPVLSLLDLQTDVADARSIDLLLAPRAGFSAVTVCSESRRLIVYNPAHPPGRRSNSLVHELSHILLDHDPSPALDHGGCRHWDERAESEADWLAGVLLVPRDGALWWIRNGGLLAEGAAHFGVSEVLFRWRINQTGVVRQVEAARRKADPLSTEIRQLIGAGAAGTKPSPHASTMVRQPAQGTQRASIGRRSGQS